MNRLDFSRSDAVQIARSELMTPKRPETACNGRFPAPARLDADSSRPEGAGIIQSWQVVSDGFDVTVATHVTLPRSNLHHVISYSYGVDRAYKHPPNKELQYICDLTYPVVTVASPMCP